MQILRNLMQVTLLLGAFSTVSAGGEGRIKVLIVDGFSNHDWKHTTRCIRSILEQSDTFDIAVSTFPEDGTEDEAKGWNPEFSAYDVVIQTCNDIGSDTRWPRRVEEMLETYVQQGGGLYVFHSANNSFPHWDAYNKMIGLGWRNKNFGWAITVDDAGKIIRIPAGEGEKTSHGKRVDALVTRLGDHPIHADLPRQWRAADIEIYRYARGPAENLTVLSYAKDEKTGLNFPIEWTVTYGSGRAYSATLGHVWHDQTEPEGIGCAGFQTLMPRIVQWLAGKKVDSSLPKDFPGKKEASVRPLAEQ